MKSCLQHCARIAVWPLRCASRSIPACRSPRPGENRSVASSELDKDAVCAFPGREVAVEVKVWPLDDLELLLVRLGERAGEDLVSNRVQEPLLAQ